ncbi:hypothetical protein O3G_MSEX006561 [Manduca sexta]|uniref:Uncharacterized protein n=2 Tax=Manduca sexta TaxID=7130 RepID=A0A921Z3Y6_MANSE|nr:hypothetical protein O3G_MSEX006561 [Manduca sexta]
MVKGYQDAKGAPIANAHLMGLFQRLCKLLYFRIKPVFVFDGAFPDLKKETIAKRQDSKAKYNSESERLKRELALILSKKTAIGNLLGKQISPKKSNNVAQDADDLFKLPALPEKEEESESESEDEQNSSGSIIDLHSVELESEKFKNLPVKEKYDLLIELKETRKMNSWGKLHELPKQSDNFSDFQMQRLLKRRKLQECLEETEKEMGDGGMSLNDLESLLNEEGIDTKIETLPTRRIASNNNTRFILINNVKQALADAKKKKEEENKASTSKIEEVKAEVTTTKATLKRNELDEDLERAIKMSLECVNEADVSVTTSKTDDSWTSCLTDSDYSDSDEDDGMEQPDMSSAKAYIMQYSDFTNKAIDKLVSGGKVSEKTKIKIPKIDEVLDEINREKSVILDRIEVLSDDDNTKQNNEIVDIQQDKVVEDKIAIESNITVKEVKQNKYFNTNDTIFLSDTDDYEDNKLDPKADEKQDSGSINLHTTINVEPHLKDTSLDETQLSVICLENKHPEVVTLDSSLEENETQNSLIISSNKSDSESSDDDFEDVSEMESKPAKTIVQLTLNTDAVLDDDDIFADVFTNTEKPPGKIFEHAEVNEEITITNTVNNVKELDVVTEGETIITGTEKIVKTCDTMLSEVDNEIKDQIVKNKTLSNIDTIEQSKNVNPSIKPLRTDDNTLDTTPPSHNDKVITTTKELISKEQLNSMAKEIQVVEDNLIQEKGRLDRVGRNITEQMTKEAQELLQLFGIPYIVAPMEAEAQCAFLESAKLTDGTITDDSDIWLFGGKTVYKNFFNQKKHVLQFLADRIEKSFNLTREKLILLALLVGSDYTTGVSGVGPVTALEILANFPFNKKQLNESVQKSRYAEMVTGLEEFKRWVRGGKRTDNTSLKKKLKNVALTEDFPSVRVVQAYLEPNVEKSDERFSWGELDITILRDYTRAKFGWSQNKLDEIIKPVLKRITERKTQKSMDDYFKRKIEFESLEDQMSKRVKAAVQRMGPSLDIPMEGQAPTEESQNVGKRKLSRTQSEGGRKINVKAGPSKGKKKKGCEESVLNEHGVKIVTDDVEGKSIFDIKIPKSDRFQEIIPQREKDKKHLLENKLKAIEMFRKTNIDRKKKTTKRKPIQPKADAELSESSDSN